jgi:hypothetical protein
MDSGGSTLCSFLKFQDPSLLSLVTAVSSKKDVVRMTNEVANLARLIARLLLHTSKNERMIFSALPVMPSNMAHLPSSAATKSHQLLRLMAAARNCTPACHLLHTPAEPRSPE